MSASPEVRIDGYYLSHLSDFWGLDTVTHRRRGPWEMTFNVDVDLGQRLPGLGAPVEAMLGPSQFWSGTLAEPDWASGSMVAIGACRQGEEVLCLGPTGATTSTPDVAIDEAITRGVLDWSQSYSLSNVPLGDVDATNDLNYLTALLDQWEAESGTTWRVDARRFVGPADLAAAPSWHILPGAELLPSSNEILAGTIFGRFKNKQGRWQTVDVGSGAPEIGVSLAKHGNITSVRATAIIQAMLDRLGAQNSWSGGIEVMAEHIVTPGGTPADPSQVVAGQMIRHLGQRNPNSRDLFTDFVLDQTAWSVPGGTIRLDPVGRVARDMRSTIEGLGGEVL